jgi:hypothetical protein
MLTEDDERRVRRILLLATGQVSIDGDDPEHAVFTVDGRPPTDDEAELLSGLTLRDLDDAKGNLLLERHLQGVEVWGQVIHAVRAELQRTREFLAQLDDPPAPTA